MIECYTVDGSPGYHYHGDAPTRHGPYIQYTRKVDGKTLTRRLTAEQAARYCKWIANRRRLDELADPLDRLSRQAAELHLAQRPRPTSARLAPLTRTAVGTQWASEKCGT